MEKEPEDGGDEQVADRVVGPVEQDSNPVSLSSQLQREMGISEALRDSLTAFRAQDEWRRGLLSVQEQLRQSSMFGIGEAMRESLAAFRAQHRWWHDLLGVQDRVRASGAFGVSQALTDSLTAFRAQDEWRQGLVRLQEELHKSSLPGIEQALQGRWLASLIAPVSDIERILRGLHEWADFADAEGFGDEVLSVGPDGSIALGGETATAAEVERALQDLFDRFSSFLTDIQSALLNLRKPVRAFLLWLMSTVIVPFLMSYYFQQRASLELREMQQQVQGDIGKTRREVLAAIKANQPKHPDLDLTPYRVVIGDDVRVRGRPNRGAQVKALLPLGTVVRFIEKRGCWTAVEYLDQDGAGTLRGWVFNKYLDRLEHRRRREG